MPQAHAGPGQGGQEDHEAAADAQQAGCQVQQVCQRLRQAVSFCGWPPWGALPATCKQKACDSAGRVCGSAVWA